MDKWVEESRNDMRYLEVVDRIGPVCYIAGRGDEYKIRSFIASAPEILKSAKKMQDILSRISYCEIIGQNISKIMEEYREEAPDIADLLWKFEE